MGEVTSYSFAVDIYKTDTGSYEYGVVQEVDDDYQLLERGEADTLIEAADMASKSIRTLFTV